jgi:hypothetical protein
MTPDDWFDLLRAQLPDPSPAPREHEIDALLDLARVAAHTSERWSAPVSTFIVGVALAGVAPEERATRIRAITDRLEAETGA